MNTFLLAVLTVCAVVLTALSLVNFLQFQWALREIRQTVGTAQNILLPVQRAVGSVENFISSFLGKRWGVRTGPRTRRHG